MDEFKLFHLGDILSITTGYLVSPDHIGGVYNICDYMSGDSNFTHQLPRVADECKPSLLKLYPWLAEIDASEVTPENWEGWMKEQTQKYGEYHKVYPLPRGQHKRINPILEAAQMISSRRDKKN